MHASNRVSKNISRLTRNLNDRLSLLLFLEKKEILFAQDKFSHYARRTLFRFYGERYVGWKTLRNLWYNYKFATRARIIVTC